MQARLETAVARLVAKYNPFHDRMGRFARTPEGLGGGGGGGDKAKAVRAEMIARGKVAMANALRGRGVPNAMYREEVGWIGFHTGTAPDQAAGLQGWGVLHIQHQRAHQYARRNGRQTPTLQDWQAAQRFMLNDVPTAIASGRVGQEYLAKGNSRRDVYWRDVKVVLGTDLKGTGQSYLHTAFPVDPKPVRKEGGRPGAGRQPVSPTGDGYSRDPSRVSGRAGAGLSRRWYVIDVIPVKGGEFNHRSVKTPEIGASAQDAVRRLVAKWNPRQPRHPKGSPRGGQFARVGAAGSITGEHGLFGASDYKLKRVFGRTADTGQPRSQKRNLTKHRIGELGEEIALAYVQQVLGDRGAFTLDMKRTNFPLDALSPGRGWAIEIKAGQVNNATSARQWRYTLGEPRRAEKRALRRMTAEQKRAYNAAKLKAVLARKQSMRAEISKQHGLKLRDKTIALIVDHDRKLADVYVFDGYHARIGWPKAGQRDARLRRAYAGTYAYRSR